MEYFVFEKYYINKKYLDIIFKPTFRTFSNVLPFCCKYFAFRWMELMKTVMVGYHHNPKV